MGRYWEEAENDYEGPAPVKAGCGVSGRRERAVRAGSANGRREWTAQAGGASGRRERVARSDGVQMGRYWEAETDHEGRGNSTEIPSPRMGPAEGPTDPGRRN